MDGCPGEKGVPIAPVNNVAQALDDPQVSHRNMVVEVDHPLAGKYRMPGNPIKMGQQEVFQPSPSLGQHNSEVLGDLLGLHYGADRRPERAGSHIVLGRPAEPGFAKTPGR